MTPSITLSNSFKSIPDGGALRRNAKMNLDDTIPMHEKTKDLPKGTKEYEERRDLLRKELSDKIPKDRWLDTDIVENVGKDVIKVVRSSNRLTAREIRITEDYDVVGLVDALSKGEFTSLEVTEAFCKRAVIAHQLTGCLVDYFEEEAFVMAKHADDHLRRTGKVLGPLHGLPISVKDHMPIKGRPASTGFISTREEASVEDCLLISILRQAGAVFYVKTNQPQSIMHLECTSYMWRTLNPYNTSLTPGGSTGGEAALIAMRGSILGLGTDIGGSIRVPGAFCGIWGLKPTSQIVPLTNMPVGVLSAPISIQCCGGPLTVSLAGVDLFMRTIQDARPERIDSQLTRCRWPTSLPSVVDRKKLRIGFMADDGHIVPQPPVQKALKWAKTQLERAGAELELVPYTPYSAAEANELIHSLYYPTGVQEIRQVLQDGGEPEYPLTAHTLRNTEAVTKDAFGVIENNGKLQDFRLRFTDHYNRYDLDAVLGPCFVGTACSHDSAFFWNYTSIWNIMDWPAFVFPTPVIASSQDEYVDEVRARTLSSASGRVVDLWNAGDFEGAPVNLQLAARRQYDNELRLILDVVQKHLSES